jgi:hypothetical protein
MPQLTKTHAKYWPKAFLLSLKIMTPHQGILGKTNLQISFVSTFYKYQPLLI